MISWACSLKLVSISPVAMAVSSDAARAAWPSTSALSSGSSIQVRSNCSSLRQKRWAVTRSHCWLASTISGKPSPSCSRTACTRLKSMLVSGWPTLILMPPIPLPREVCTFSRTFSSGVDR
ncbi:hypothetical protein D3C81_1507760 [compost metagenome]